MAFLFEQTGDIFCVATDDAPIDDATFDRWLEAMARAKEPRIRAFVWSGDGAPSIFQRSRLNHLTQRKPVRLSVLTESRIARGAIQAFSWMSEIEIAGFRPDHIDDAIAFLEHGPATTSVSPMLLDPPRKADLRQAIQELHVRALATTRRSAA